MDLGIFSVSLAVQDLSRSLAFYSAFGFEVIGGDSENYAIIQNGQTKLGLFQGMFDENILTFHPPDVRAIQAQLKEEGIPLNQEAEDGEGPAHAVVTDPDGNTILLDQF